MLQTGHAGEDADFAENDGVGVGDLAIVDEVGVASAIFRGVALDVQHNVGFVFGASGVRDETGGSSTAQPSANTLPANCLEKLPPSRVSRWQPRQQSNGEMCSRGHSKSPINSEGLVTGKQSPQ
jgi:hypothetical protein